MEEKAQLDMAAPAAALDKEQASELDPGKQEASRTWPH